MLRDSGPHSASGQWTSSSESSTSQLTDPKTSARALPVKQSNLDPDARLIIAVETGHFSAVQKAISDGADPGARKRVVLTVKFKFGETKTDERPAESALCLAIRAGRQHIVRILLEAGLDPNDPVDYAVPAAWKNWSLEDWASRWSGSTTRTYFPSALDFALHDEPNKIFNRPGAVVSFENPAVGFGHVWGRWTCTPNLDIVRLLLKHGARVSDSTLRAAVRLRDRPAIGSPPLPEFLVELEEHQRAVSLGGTQAALDRITSAMRNPARPLTLRKARSMTGLPSANTTITSVSGAEALVSAHSAASASAYLSTSPVPPRPGSFTRLYSSDFLSPTDIRQNSPGGEKSYRNSATWSAPSSSNIRPSPTPPPTNMGHSATASPASPTPLGPSFSTLFPNAIPAHLSHVSSRSSLLSPPPPQTSYYSNQSNHSDQTQALQTDFDRDGALETERRRVRVLEEELDRLRAMLRDRESRIVELEAERRFGSLKIGSLGSLNKSGDRDRERDREGATTPKHSPRIAPSPNPSILPPPSFVASPGRSVASAVVESGTPAADSITFMDSRELAVAASRAKSLRATVALAEVSGNGVTGTSSQSEPAHANAMGGDKKIFSNDGQASEIGSSGRRLSGTDLKNTAVNSGNVSPSGTHSSTPNRVPSITSSAQNFSPPPPQRPASRPTSLAWRDPEPEIETGSRSLEREAPEDVSQEKEGRRRSVPGHARTKSGDSGHSRSKSGDSGRNYNRSKSRDSRRRRSSGNTGHLDSTVEAVSGPLPGPSLVSSVSPPPALSTVSPPPPVSDTSAAMTDGSNQSEPPVPVHRVMYCVSTFLPQYEDELRLAIGDLVFVNFAFADGWSTGFHVASGVSGAFPMACVSALPSKDGQGGLVSPALQAPSSEQPQNSSAVVTPNPVSLIESTSATPDTGSLSSPFDFANLFPKTDRSPSLMALYGDGASAYSVPTPSVASFASGATITPSAMGIGRRQSESISVVHSLRSVSLRPAAPESIRTTNAVSTQSLRSSFSEDLGAVDLPPLDFDMGGGGRPNPWAAHPAEKLHVAANANLFKPGGPRATSGSEPDAHD
ncbi:hypothetical protein HDU93_006619 [Gonapodya sp. JEL0774]|nr:hypothetical protein HDU93_006619 [Gonapodya sp. JEL0774]